MTTPQKNKIKELGNYAGCILSIIVLVSTCFAFSTGLVNKIIDNRIDIKNEYIVALLEAIATDQQRDTAKKIVQYRKLYKGE